MQAVPAGVRNLHRRKRLGSMRHMARGHMFPDYEELQRDSPGSTVRLFVFLIYFIVNVIVTAALILLVVLAPTRWEFLIILNTGQS